jgi:hypothetical protein
MAIAPDPPSPEFYFSPVQGGPLRRIRKAIGLVPEKGGGLALRVVVIVAIAWLPVIVGALIAGQALGGPDPLLRHFGVHARFLIAVPLLIFTEAFMERLIPPMVHHFATSGLVNSDNLPEFREALSTATRLRDSILGSMFVLVVVGLVVLNATVSGTSGEEVSWAVAHPGGQANLGFAGWWYTFVARPIFAGLIAIWIWRILALWILFWKLSGLDLRLVASHPDRIGGLGFMEGLTVACAPIVLAMSVVLAGRWGHDVLYHGVHVDSLRPLVIAFAVAMLIVFNGPLFVLGRRTRAFKRAKLLEYSALVGNHGYLVYRKWIGGQDVGEPEVLDAPELGPTVDISSIYQAVAQMRFAPIGKSSVVTIAVASLLPMLPVFAIEIPIKQMLGALTGALF